MSKNIYVGNLPYNISQEELSELFGQYGQVQNVHLITDKFTGRSKGFAFVEMVADEEAEQAIKALHEADLQGRNITVNEARPRETSFGGGGGGSRGGDRGDRGGFRETKRW